jgi:hypothetical protein
MVPSPYPQSRDFEIGRAAGLYVGGACQILAGGGATVAGGGVTVASGGAGAVVGAPVAVWGTAATANGVLSVGMAGNVLVSVGEGSGSVTTRPPGDSSAASAGVNVSGPGSGAAEAAPRGPGFPGSDPTKPPEGFLWKGRPGSAPGSREGNYVKPETRESLRPDLDHPDPVGPHWDYRDGSGKWWRIGPDGRMDPK